MNPPLLSVIVPAYNAAQFIADAIDSILDQRYQNLEIIVVDDGSSDGTGSVLPRAESRLRYLRQENRGPAGARNQGLSMARGELISFLDADDLWPANAIDVLTRYLGDHRDVDIAMGRLQYARHVPSSAPGKSRLDPFAEPCVSLSLDAGVFRRAVFKKVGHFDVGMQTSEDIDWFMRAREAGIAIHVVPDVVLLYRRHDQNLTQDRDVSHSDFARALKKSLDRRRLTTGGAQSLPSIVADQERPEPHR